MKDKSPLDIAAELVDSWNASNHHSSESKLDSLKFAIAALIRDTPPDESQVHFFLSKDSNGMAVAKVQGQRSELLSLIISLLADPTNTTPFDLINAAFPIILMNKMIAKLGNDNGSSAANTVV